MGCHMRCDLLQRHRLCGIDETMAALDSVAARTGTQNTPASTLL
jgi:hypothetical protein